ncbi:hypothetical protein AB6806_23895 [Bosea sp. RCC_152_1]|uniref:hypothetical protein n=1 Tax=Bosea sp. RCC_152_1 TaxID=3239228 RepID=UPI003526AA53
MNIIDLGSWGAPVRYEDPETGISFARYENAAGEDWYASVAHNEDRPRGFVVGLDEAGKVLFAADDVSKMEPGNKRVLVLPDFTGDLTDLVGKFLDTDTGELTSPPPVIVSRAQAQMALFNAGLLDDLETIIANHPYRPVRIWYESANIWERANPYVSMLAPELNLTEEQIDALFVAAAKL